MREAQARDVFREQRREGFLLLLELGELDFDQFVPVEFVGRRVLFYFREFQAFGKYMKEVFHWTFRRPFRAQLLFSQMEFIGNQSLNILMISGLAVGAVFGLQIGAVFRVFGAFFFLAIVTRNAKLAGGQVYVCTWDGKIYAFGLK